MEHGTQAPVAMVAKELGVSPATLFVRMGTKNKLISAAFWPPDPPVLAVLEDNRIDTKTIEAQWIDIVADLAAWANAAIPATFTLYGAGLRPKPSDDFADATPARLRRALKKRIRDAVNAGTVECDPRMAAEVLLGTLEARAMHALLGRRELSARETREFARALVETALRPKATPAP